jgi:hypothetical protein
MGFKPGMVRIVGPLHNIKSGEFEKKESSPVTVVGTE